MLGCNTIVNYGPYMIVFQCLSEKKGEFWCYHVIHVGGNGKVPVPKPVGLQPNDSLSVIIPLCNDIKPCQVRCRSVTCAESFCTKVGFDPQTGIYGIRFNIKNPFTNFTICFKTPKRKPKNQTLGLVANGNVFNNEVICSPGCKHSTCMDDAFNPS